MARPPSVAPHGERGFDVLLADIRTPDARAVALVDAVRVAAPSLPVLVVTGSTGAARLSALHALGTAVLVKPFTPEELDAAVRAVVAAPCWPDPPLAPSRRT